MAEHCEEGKISKLTSQTGGEEEGGVGAKTIYTGEKNLDETRHTQTSCVQRTEGKAEKSFVLMSLPPRRNFPAHVSGERRRARSPNYPERLRFKKKIKRPRRSKELSTLEEYR
jgi:hypothetical protein